MRLLFFSEGNKISDLRLGRGAEGGAAQPGLAAEPKPVQLACTEAELSGAGLSIGERAAYAALRERILEFWGVVRFVEARWSSEEFSPEKLKAALAELKVALSRVQPELELECYSGAASAGAAPVFLLRARGYTELYPLASHLMALRGAGEGALQSTRPQLHFRVGLPRLGHAAAIGWARSSELLRGARVRVGFVRGHLLELAFGVLGCSGVEDQAALEAVTDYAEAALGERLFDTWVGNIGVYPGRRASPLQLVREAKREGAEEDYPLEQLAPLVERAIAGLIAGLKAPKAGLASRSGWTLLEANELHRELSGEFPEGMKDILLTSTFFPELLKSYLEGVPISSERFSYSDEVFVYVRVPCGAPLSERPAFREPLEAALEAALGSFGYLMGQAVGHEHVYILLALRSFGEAVQALRAFFEHRGKELFPPGVELRFFDTMWQSEYVRLTAAPI